jgi:hypothetical protein
VTRSSQDSLTLAFSFAWALFLVFEEVVLRLPWPLQDFVLRQFPDEFVSQRALVEAWAKLSVN